MTISVRRNVAMALLIGSRKFGESPRPGDGAPHCGAPSVPGYTARRMGIGV